MEPLASSKRAPDLNSLKLALPFVTSIRLGALSDILGFIERLEPVDRSVLRAKLDGYLLPSGRRWVEAAAEG